MNNKIKQAIKYRLQDPNIEDRVIIDESRHIGQLVPDRSLNWGRGEYKDGWFYMRYVPEIYKLVEGTLGKDFVIRIYKYSNFIGSNTWLVAEKKNKSWNFRLSYEYPEVK